jgi:transposase
MRAIGLDVHLEFCEVAISEQGKVRSAGRIATKPDEVELFAQSLGSEDRVALEVTGNAWEIKRILDPHVAEVIVASPTDTGIRGARAKTDRLDARTLARLLASGELEAVWMPDRRTQVMRRRLQRRNQLIWGRSKAKNQISSFGRLASAATRRSLSPRSTTAASRRSRTPPSMGALVCGSPSNYARMPTG